MTKVVVATADSEAPSGGVQLLIRALACMATPSDVTVELASDCEVASRIDDDSIIFRQSEGIRDTHISAAISTWLGKGALVVEQNIFALTMSDRPEHPNYYPAFMSSEGIMRYALRCRLGGVRARTRVMLLPNPTMRPVRASLDSMHPRGMGETISALRVGRPDPRKWTSFEVGFMKKVALSDPTQLYKLVLVGAPDTMTWDHLPSNLTITRFPYDPDPLRFYESASFYLHHSRIGETFGNTLVDAVTTGVPVIAAFSPGWDCAPVEYLDRHDNCLVGSPRQLLRKTPDLRDLLTLPRNADARCDFMSVQEFLFKLLQVKTCAGQEAMILVPEATQALKDYFLLSRRLGCGPAGSVGGLIRELRRSWVRRMRSLT